MHQIGDILSRFVAAELRRQSDPNAASMPLAEPTHARDCQSADPLRGQLEPVEMPALPCQKPPANFEQARTTNGMGASCQGASSAPESHALTAKSFALRRQELFSSSRSFGTISARAVGRKREKQCKYSIYSCTERN